MLITTQTKNILAFYSPYPRAGKTTAALYIKDIISDSEVLSFSTPIKEFVNKVLIKLKDDNEDTYKDTPIEQLKRITKRDLYTSIANSARSVYPDIWVDYLHNQIENSNHHFIIIDDLRFPNECNMLMSLEAKIVRITNPNREVVKSESEGLLEDNYSFDYEIENRKQTFDDYYLDLNELISSNYITV